MAVVYEAADHQLLLYTSGGYSIGTPTAFSTHQAIPTGSGPFAIGRKRADGTSRYWNGWIAAPVVFQGVADQGELMDLEGMIPPWNFTQPVSGSPQRCGRHLARLQSAPPRGVATIKTAAPVVRVAFTST